MSYKVETLESKIGKGVSITKGNSTYIQINCRDGLTLRVHKNANEILKDNKKYYGILFKPLKDTGDDYQIYKRITARLEQFCDKEVNNSRHHFTKYTSHLSYTHKFKKINAKLEVQPWNGIHRYMHEAGAWFLNTRSHLVGLIPELMGIGALYLGTGSLSKTFSAALGLSIVEGLTGFAPIDGKGYWCGPIHALGFIPARKYFERKLKRPNYILDKFLKTYEEVEKLKNDVSKHRRKFIKQSKKLDYYFEIIQQLFKRTDSWKGLQITSESKNKQEILDSFDKILEGKAKLPFNYTTKKKTIKNVSTLPKSLTIETIKDELTDRVKAISKLGEDLLHRHTDNEVTKGILNMHSPYIEEYIEKAGEYVNDYRSSTQYLENFDIAGIKQEIKALSDKIKKGKKEYGKILQERKDTLKNINKIKENRETIKTKLWETQATLQSLHASILNVETGTNKEEAMKEIQRSVSNLSKALDKNFGDSEEEILEEKVSVG